MEVVDYHMTDAGAAAAAAAAADVAASAAAAVEEDVYAGRALSAGVRHVRVQMSFVEGVTVDGKNESDKDATGGRRDRSSLTTTRHNSDNAELCSLQ